jgi:hypothetical protein
MEASVQLVRALGERLHKHRQERQAAHPDLMITSMYNVLARLKEGEALIPSEQATYESALVGILMRLHDELDAAVLEAYGLPADAADQAILDRLATLNAERADEERRGLVRWIRPSFQHTGAKEMLQVTLVPEEEDESASAVTASGTSSWPKKLPEQIAGLRDLVLRSPSTWTAKQAASAFKGAKPGDVEPVLESLAALGLLVSWSSGAERQWKAARS